MWSKTLLSVLLLVGVVHGQTANLYTFLRLMTSLKINDECSYSNEEMRQNLTKSVASLSLNNPGLRLTMERFTNDVVNNNKKFCSAPELLVCEKDTSTCVCGDPGKSVLMPNSNSSADFVQEIDETGDLRCRWAENAYCLSSDILKNQGFGSLVNSKCQQGTICTSKANGDECSFSTLVLYIFQQYRFGAARNQRQIMEDVFNGKVCSCQPDRSINSVTSDSDEFFNTISARRKRSVQHEMVDEESMNSFGAPVAYLQQLFI